MRQERTVQDGVFGLSRIFGRVGMSPHNDALLSLERTHQAILDNKALIAKVDGVVAALPKRHRNVPEKVA